MRNIKTESNSIPIVNVKGKVHMEGNVYDLYSVVKEQNDNCLLLNVLCFYKESFYIYVLGENRVDHIASITVEEENYTVLAEMSHSSNAIVDGNLIKMEDGENIVEFNIVTSEVRKYAGKLTDTYNDFPKIIADFETIELINDNGSISFTVLEMTESSPGISYLYNYKNKKTWCGDCRFDGLSIPDGCFANDHIYAVAGCLSYDGTLFAALLEYDVNNSSWIYVSGGYNCADTLHGFSIVPIIET